MTENNKEILILENIYQSSPEIRQRDLAKIAGFSLGMTNAIVKRLSTKGLLTVKRINNRNIHYIVTASGIEEITKRSYHYFKRTIKNVVYYKEAIECFVLDVKSQGYDGLILKGASDLDFIVEHACRESNIKYIKEDGINNNIFILYSENYLPDKETMGVGRAFLQSVLI